MNRPIISHRPFPAVAALCVAHLVGPCPAAEPQEGALIEEIEEAEAVGDVPGPDDTITTWQRAARLPWVDAVAVEGGGLALVLDGRRAAYSAMLDLRDGTPVVVLSPGLPAGGPPPADYAALVADNPARVAAVRRRLVGSSEWARTAGGPAAAADGGAAAVAAVAAADVADVRLRVSADETTDDPTDVLVDPQISLDVPAADGRRFIYLHRMFGDGPETAERWTYAPADGDRPARWTRARPLGGGGTFLTGH